MNSYTLNAIGQAQVLAFVAETARTPDRFRKDAFFADAEQSADDAFDSGAEAVIEMGGHYTTTGNPVTLNCPRHWFDATPID